MGRGGAAAGGANAGDADSSSSDANDSVRLLSLSWNQDNSCFTAGTTADLRVFTCAAPFQEKLRRVLPGGFAVAEILFRPPIFAVVAAGEEEEGGGARRVMVRDDSPNPSLCANLDFPSAVRGVRLSRDYLVVVLDTAVIVYNLCACVPPPPPPTRPPKPLWKVDTAPNPRGLCCLSCHVDSSVLACPGTERGQVCVQDLRKVKKRTTKTLIAAHTSDLACMAMAADGAVLATASVKGTLVRVFNAMDGTCLQEVRRGRDQADIYSIALSPELEWLAVCSDKGTLHVFRLRVATTAGDEEKDDGGGKQSAETATARSALQANTASNARSSLSFMKVILPGYFSSEWSFAQFRLPETTHYVVAFGEHNTVMIIGMDGSFYRCSFDPVKGKEMVRNEFFRFINDKDAPPPKTLAT